MRIFWKQLLIYLITIVISFVLLAFVLAQGIRGFLTDQKVDELTTLAQRVAISMENFSLYGLFNIPLLQTELQNIYRYTDAMVVIIDNNFDVIPFGGELAAGLDMAELSPLMAGETVVIFSTLDHQTNEPLLIVGHPFWFNDQVIGAALVAFSMASLDNAISEMYRMAMIALAGTGAFAFILIYISSRAISRPLQQMSQAATEIAGGDFEKRLTYQSGDEVGQLAHQFNRMAESLQEQERIRREFIANISHDIRSPLTSIRGFLTAFEDGTIPSEQQPYYLNIIMGESERLIKLSNNILDIHSIQDSQMQLTTTEFDVNNVIRDTILSFKQRALDKRIMINSRFAHSSDIVLADEEKIRRIILNLLDNAIKFTGEGGEITVETTVDEQNNKVSVSISDTGTGMTEEEQKRVFDRFYKGDTSRNEDKMGSGLGLSIVREFVRAHNETITLESEPGRGSVFVFTITKNYQ